ncbi:alpha-L-rhamnosidase [Anaerosporobacter sp.]|uniref:alpha-L-rhamnosidase n=1 Tax=Anaerosporobacter sp. TaxID=1872529 RepID=UPI00286EC7F7|nr:family 78 glycoside hydrolase catalytic domain [Anaerosporobacter sp.]
MKIIDVRVNGIKNPLGYHYEYIVCSWKVIETKGIRQENVRIEVSDTKAFTKLIYEKEGKELNQAGERLELSLLPRTAYYVRIQVRTEQEEAVSDIYCFETGKMEEQWEAKWILAEKQDTCHPILFRNFTTRKKVERARLYMTGVGLFETYLNGKLLENEYLAPYLNNYEETIQVITFALEENLKEENTLEILLGNGWYRGLFGLELKKENYGTDLAAIAELHIEYEDGSKEVILTDEQWQYYASDIEDSGIYDGEIINRLLWAGKENKPKSVRVVENSQENSQDNIGNCNLNKAHLIDRISLPVCVQEELPVQEIINTPSGETVLDMGQNFAGYLEFEACLPKGTKVVFDFGEILQDNNFYNKNYRDAKSQFIYIANGEREIVRPHFTYFGFRYVRVSGWHGEIDKSDFVGKVIYSDITRTGYIETGDKRINRLYENTVWGLKSNFIDIPTDCPQRSERLGWTGDAQVFAATASYHMDTRAFFHKYINDLKSEQKILDGGIPNFVPNIGHKQDVGSVWGDAATIIPDTLFRYYGNSSELEYAYPMMCDWIDYITRKDCERGQKYLFNFGFCFGDWLALDGATIDSFKGSTDDAYIASVYYYHSCLLTSKAAEVLGKTEEVVKYKKLADKIKKAILQEYFTPSGRLAIDTQAAYVIALRFEIYIDKQKLIEQFKTRLQKDCNRIKCGFVGAPLLCMALAEIGELELAYDFLLKEGFPGWLYEVDMGATTIWERWNSVLEDGTISPTGMNSLNHYAYGSVMEFVYAYAGGIRSGKNGFKDAVIEPNPDIRLGYVNARYDSVYGTYICNWKIEQDGYVQVYIEIPFDCQANVRLPEYEEESMQLVAGSYRFRYLPKKDFRKPYHLDTTLARLARDRKAMEILRKYVPAIAGIAASGAEEMGATSLRQIFSMHYLPFEPEQLQLAVDELVDLIVTIEE